MSKTTIFAPADLQKIVNETIPAAVPGDDHQFVVVGGVDQQGSQVVARFEKKSDQGWTLDADAVWRHQWSGDNQVGAQVLLKW
jgi:hypothetical protein